MNQMHKGYNDEPGMGAKVLRVVPWALSVIILLYLVMGVVRVGQSEGLYRFDFDTLGKVPVSEDGRIKPLDTVARNALLQVSGKQSLKKEMLLKGEGDAEKPAILWLAELISQRPESRQRKVIRIDDPGVLGILGKTTDDGKFYSLNDLSVPTGEKQQPAYMEIDRLAREAQRKRDDERTRFEEHVIGVRGQVGLMLELQAMATPFVVPPVEKGDEWAPIVENPQLGLTDAARDRESGATWLRMMEALGSDNPEAFKTALADHMELKQAFVPGKARKAVFEQGYNRYAPFAKGIALYILAGLLGLLAMLLRPILPKDGYTALWRSGMGVLIVVFVLHTAALLIRIWLQGRPPVTNLYSSAVFIGWGIVGGAIILEKITKLGVASLAASSAGVSTLIVAHHLSKDGDTMGVMQAVLDSNFWLGTHVITITLGYSATFLAGFIAILYIFFGLCTPILDRKMARAMAGMVYAVICFAILFSFVGTVLGGIWADQSWGRFWGWDPKENGAILIVLIQAIILHARWGHLVKERGLMVLAVSGNIITAWSWFGTNLLGVGLHSYGFMDGAMLTLAAFVASQMFIMAAAMMFPTEMWWSFRKPKKKKKPANDSAAVATA
jgi:ABC-type transport system involved in cytochrome c biogenesis permease subunit